MRAAEALLSRRVADRRGTLHTDELDRTGICVSAAQRLPVEWSDSEVVFPLYEDSIAHSFWRAQEFSLFRRHRHLLSRPLLDFGCGDGSFAAVLFDDIDFGVDIDEQALDLARQFGLYGNLLQPREFRIPLNDGTVGSVFSNSVLEHVMDLDIYIAEISRVLAKGGSFLFTVPVAQFARDLERYFGRAESVRVNSDYFHRNLFELDRWRTLLETNRLSVVSIQEYQPAWFTFYYMMFRLFGNRALARLFPGIRRSVWKRYGGKLVDMVRHSVSGEVSAGANVFVIAEKVAD